MRRLLAVAFLLVPLPAVAASLEAGLFAAALARGALAANGQPSAAALRPAKPAFAPVTLPLVPGDQLGPALRRLSSPPRPSADAPHRVRP